MASSDQLTDDEAMIFSDEESRHQYHQAPALLQVICQVMEAYLTEHGAQLEFVETEKRMGLWLAAVTVENIHLEALDGVVDRVNRMFQRKDDVPTCQIESEEVGLLSVRVTDSADFAHAN